MHYHPALAGADAGELTGEWGDDGNFHYSDGSFITPDGTHHYPAPMTGEWRDDGNFHYPDGSFVTPDGAHHHPAPSRTSDFEYVESNHDEELTCSICLSPFVDPRTCAACGHCFCLAHTPTLTNCPLCRASWTGRPLLQPARLVLNMLDRLLVRCPNARCDRGRTGLPLQRGDLASHIQQCGVPCAAGCGANVAPRDVATHNTLCPAAFVTCNSHDCNHIAARAAMPAHEATCPAAVVSCPHGCRHRCPRRELAAHDALCPEVVIACPFGCGVSLPRRDVAAHETPCSLEAVACPSADVGCVHSAPRRALAEHVSSCELHRDRRVILLERALEAAQQRIMAGVQQLEHVLAQQLVAVQEGIAAGQQRLEQAFAQKVNALHDRIAEGERRLENALQQIQQHLRQAI